MRSHGAGLAARAFLLLLFIGQTAFANAVEEKNFYLLTILPRHQMQIAPDLLRAKRAALHDAATACGPNVQCVTSKLRFSDAEIAAAADALRKWPIIGSELRDKHHYIRYEKGSDADLLVAAWTNAAHGINHIIDVYGDGKPPLYPEIDSPSFDVHGEEYGALVHTTVQALDERSFTWFFEPSLEFALHLLQLNDRDEAGRFEPLPKPDLRSIHWDDYPYTLILIPGFGPTKTGWPLSPEGRLRLEIAVRRYREHKAPLIVVSGGYVHPNQTHYCEAIEMKKALVRDYHVPADAILIEPHARHTTTNLRNTVRLMVRDGIPLHRKALVTTDEFQTDMIASPDFAKRNLQELGYEPATIGRRLSVFDLEFTPNLESLQIDPMDPLDP